MARLSPPTFVITSLALLPLLLFCYAVRFVNFLCAGRAGVGLGRLLHALHFRRRIVEANLELALGKEKSARELAELSRLAYANIGRTFVEIARNFTLTKERMVREVEFGAPERARLAEVIARGKGVVLISGHIANWELLAMSVAAQGFPSAIVVKKMNNAFSQALIERQRKRTGLDVIYSGGTIEKMRTALAAGTLIGFMMDQNVTGKKGIRCNFFGVPAASIKALGPLIRDSGAAVMPMCVFRQPDGTQKVYLGEVLPYLTAPEADPRDRALREEWLNAQQYQRAIEELVRMHPEQWLWIHRRWKCRRDPLDPATAHLENRD